MRRFVSRSVFLTVFFATSAVSFAQSDYKVLTVPDGGTISGTVKWSGPVPHAAAFPITKDPQICDPDSKKSTALQRLIVGSGGLVANTVVYLKNISSRKAMDLPANRRHLIHKHSPAIPPFLRLP